MLFLKVVVSVIVILIGITAYSVDRRRRGWPSRMRRVGKMWDEEDGAVVAMPADGSRALETLATMSESCGRWKSIEFSPRFIRRLCHEMEGAGKDGAVVPYDVFMDGLGSITYALSLYRGDKDAKVMYDSVGGEDGKTFESWIREVDDFIDFFDV